MRRDYPTRRTSTPTPRSHKSSGVNCSPLRARILPATTKTWMTVIMPLTRHPCPKTAQPPHPTKTIFDKTNPPVDRSGPKTTTYGRDRPFPTQSMIQICALPTRREVVALPRDYESYLSSRERSSRAPARRVRAPRSSLSSTLPLVQLHATPMPCNGKIDTHHIHHHDRRQGASKCLHNTQ